MQAERVYKRPTWVRILVSVASILLLIGSIWLIGEVDAGIEGNSIASTLISLIILIALIGLVSVIRYRVIVGDDHLELRDIRTRRIRYDEVIAIYLESDCLLLRRQRGSLQIGSAVRNRQELHAEIAEKLQRVNSTLPGLNKLIIPLAQVIEARRIFSDEMDRWAAKGFEEVRAFDSSQDEYYHRQSGEDEYCVQVIKMPSDDDFVHLLLQMSGPGTPKHSFMSRHILYYRDGRVDVKF